MKKILLIFALLISTFAIGQVRTTTVNNKLQLKETPNLSIIDSLVTKDSNQVLRTTSFLDLQSQLGLSPTPGIYLKNIVEDLSPQLGGNLDLNNFDITGVGNINNTGSITSTSTIQGLDVISNNNLTVAGNLLLSNYPNIRVDATAVNFLHTDISGNVLSSPVNDVITSNTSELINDGEDGVNPYITLNDVVPLQRNTLFLSSTGNDGTAVENNPNLPFQTLDGVVTHLLAQAHLGLNWFIETLDDGTFTYTLDSKVVDGFNIINTGGSTITIANAVQINKQWIFDFKIGTLIFNLTDSTTLLNSSFIYHISNATNRYVYQNVSNIIVRNSTIAQTDVARGIMRSIGVVDKFLWQNVTIEQGGYKLIDTGAVDGELIKFGTIINNNDTTLTGKAIFESNNVFYEVNIIINEYHNQSTATHTLCNAASIYTPTISIGGIISPNSLTILKASKIFFHKNNGSFQNIVIASNSINTTVTIDGLGNTVTFDHNIATRVMYNTGGSAKTNPTGYEPDKYSIFKNMTIKVPVGSSLLNIGAIDIRYGRNGSTMIFDNVNFDIDNGIAPLTFVNWVRIDVDTQFILRNNITLLNGTYLISGTAPTGTLPNLIVKENASIYHDFGLIGADADIQTTIPDISTY